MIRFQSVTSSARAAVVRRLAHATNKNPNTRIFFIRLLSLCTRTLVAVRPPAKIQFAGPNRTLGLRPNRSEQFFLDVIPELISGPRKYRLWGCAPANGWKLLFGEAR